jgi:hypothetical protein
MKRNKNETASTYFVSKNMMVRDTLSRRKSRVCPGGFLVWRVSLPFCIENRI